MSVFGLSTLKPELEVALKKRDARIHQRRLSTIYSPLSTAPNAQ